MAIALQAVEQGAGGGDQFNLQDFRAEIVDMVGDASYPTGGSTPVAVTLGFQRLIALIPIYTPGFVFAYHPDTDKLQAFWTGAAVSSALAEVANATNMSGTVFRFLAIGN